MSIADANFSVACYQIFSDLLASRNVREVSEIVDVFICQDIRMFHIAIASYYYGMFLVVF